MVFRHINDSEKKKPSNIYAFLCRIDWKFKIPPISNFLSKILFLLFLFSIKLFIYCTTISFIPDILPGRVRLLGNILVISVADIRTIMPNMRTVPTNWKRYSLKIWKWIVPPVFQELLININADW